MNVENEVRYYYSLDQENKIVKYMKTIKELTYKENFMKKQFNMIILKKKIVFIQKKSMLDSD